MSYSYASWVESGRLGNMTHAYPIRCFISTASKLIHKNENALVLFYDSVPLGITEEEVVGEETR